jgi:hypothetical protein
MMGGGALAFHPFRGHRLANVGRIAAVLSYTVSDLLMTFFDLFWLPSEQE